MATSGLVIKAVTTAQSDGEGKRISLPPLSVRAGRTFVKRGINYTTFIFWALRDSFRGHALTLIGIFVLSGMYLAAQGAAIFLLYWYARQMQADGGLILPEVGIDWQARTDMVLLWTVVISATLLFVASSVCLFLARRIVFKIVGKTYRRGLETVPRLIIRLPDPRAPTASRLALDLGFGRLLAGCRQATSAIVAFTNAVPPLIGSLGAIAFLIWSDPLLTLMLFAAFVLWATLLYPVALRGSQLTLQNERAYAKYRKDVQQLERSHDIAGTTAELASVDAFIEAYLGKRSLKHEIALVLQIGATVIVALAVVYMARHLMSGGGDWPIFIAYIAGLRLALAGGSGAVTAFASISRFYPRMVSSFLFAKDAAALDQQVLGTLSPGEAAMLGRLPSGGDVIARGGDRLAVLTWDDAREVEFALLGAKSLSTSLPLEADWWDPATKNNRPETSLLLVEASKLPQDKGASRCVVAGPGVMLVVHRDATKIGEFGETHLLAINGRTLKHFLPLDSVNADKFQEILRELESRRSVGKGFAANEDDDEF